ncbi:hypothetical protein K488DRAFT_88648 [Vararia minispora EC-137]|uniref:Uncharacterized protein n=1 Tax=Vararia minispora EC-137 TaxID=1314806 RepID=A0ACB8QCU5_9AGAM|nr:hypothetical protein K488DRAFT_88648 [Vararia minispora EC-137]
MQSPFGEAAMIISKAGFVIEALVFTRFDDFFDDRSRPAPAKFRDKLAPEVHPYPQHNLQTLAKSTHAVCGWNFMARLCSEWSHSLESMQRLKDYVKRLIVDNGPLKKNASDYPVIKGSQFLDIMYDLTETGPLTFQLMKQSSRSTIE